MAATTKVTVTLPEDLVKKVRALVKKGKSPNVAAFVKHAVDVALWDATDWDAVVKGILEGTGGPLTAKEEAWADSALPKPSRSSRSQTPDKAKSKTRRPKSTARQRVVSRTRRDSANRDARRRKVA